MADAAWHLHRQTRCADCGVGISLAEVLQETHVCDPDDRLAHEAVLLAEQIELLHFEIDEYLRSHEGQRQSRFARWCREHQA
jgi:hypothetical protein